MKELKNSKRKKINVIVRLKMKLFKINNKIEIVCNSESTRYGFRHLATLFVNGIESEKGKCTYQNRTWESYEFQSVLFDVVNKSTLSEEDKKLCKDFIDNYKDSNSMIKSTVMVAKLGDLFCNNLKDKNDWKKRMLKAGLSNSGLSFPDDWDKLSEEEKQKRLDKSIELMRK